MKWLDLLAGVPAAIADFFKAREERKSIERVRKIELDDAMHARRITLIAQGLAADASWESDQIRNSGWKDEYVLLVISIPLVGCFIPVGSEFVLRGFEVLSQTPGWYQFLVLTVFLAVYGIRYWRREQSDT